MSKSIDNILKQLLDSQEAQTKAFEEKFTSFASENCTYTERMKKMEENLTEAMKKVLEMDANIKDYHKATGSKVEQMEKMYGEMFKPKDENAERKEEEKKHEENEPASIEKQEQKEMKDSEKKEDEKKEDKKEHLKEDTKEFNEEKKNLMKKGEEVEKEDEGDEEADKEASNQIGGINKQQMVLAPANQKRHKENPLGKPKNAKDKLIVDGAVPSAQEETPSAQAEEAVEAPVAKETVSAPVALESSATSALEALNFKIEAAIQKLASLTVAKPQASTEVSVADAQALEVKALEAKAYKALEEKFEALMSKVGSLEKSASTVESKAAQIVAKQGTEAVAISVDQVPVAQTDSDIYKEFEALSGVEQRKFYLANKQTIERHASSILRSKRS